MTITYLIFSRIDIAPAEVDYCCDSSQKKKTEPVSEGERRESERGGKHLQYAKRWRKTSHRKWTKYSLSFLHHFLPLEWYLLWSTSLIFDVCRYFGGACVSARPLPCPKRGGAWPSSREALGPGLRAELTRDNLHSSWIVEHTRLHTLSFRGSSVELWSIVTEPLLTRGNSCYTLRRVLTSVLFYSKVWKFVCLFLYYIIC